MKLYMKCTRNGGDSFSKHEGMDEETITALLTSLGGTNIVVVTEEDFIASLAE